MVHKMLLVRQDLYNVRRSLDLDINSARHTLQLGHVVTEKKEAIHQEVIGTMECTCEESPHPVSYTHLTLPTIYSV